MQVASLVMQVLTFLALVSIYGQLKDPFRGR